MSISTVALALALLALIVGLFVLAMIEASLLHVRRSAIASDASSGDSEASRLLDLLDDLPSVMNAVLLAVLLSQVTATSLAGTLAQRWFGGIGVTLATIAVTVLLFIYGEAIPKTIAIADPAHYARKFSRASRMLQRSLAPVVGLLVKAAKLLSPGTNRIDTVSGVSESELRHLTDEAAAAGRIDDSDADLIQRSFTLGDLRAADVMTPIDQVVSVSGTTPIHTALKIALEAGHRRIPVHAGQPNQLLGFVRLRDLADACTANTNVSTPRHVRAAVTAGATTPAIDVLREMQKSHRHLAIVAGTDGSALGIVTVEDIVEELVGEIDEPTPQPTNSPAAP